MIPECYVDAPAGGEYLQWVRLGKPDEEITVMLFVPGSDEEVWPGYWDGEEWYWVGHAPVEDEVIAWAHMPRGWGL